MQITEITCDLLHVPLERPRASPAEEKAGRRNSLPTLLVQLRTDTGHTGVGYAYLLQSSGRALHALAIDDLTPLLVGEDPRDTARLANKVYWRLQTVGRLGLVMQAYSAFDVAMWDLKGKSADQPLYKILGGARESVPIYGSDTGWLWMSPGEIIEASKPYLDRGMMGIKVKVGVDPAADEERITSLRDEWGDDVWFGVDANQRYNYETAVGMGQFFEEMSIDWFEEPISCEDIAGHVRLSQRLDIPLAAGEMLFSRDEFLAYMEKDALAVLQPDITRLGGITGFLQVAALSDQFHRPMAPHLQPEIAVHLGCGIPSVMAVEYMPWHYGLFRNPPKIVDGKLVPNAEPGLGLEIDPDAVERWRVATS